MCSICDPYETDVHEANMSVAKIVVFLWQFEMEKIKMFDWTCRRHACCSRNTSELCHHRLQACGHRFMVILPDSANMRLRPAGRCQWCRSFFISSIYQSRKDCLKNKLLRRFVTAKGIICIRSSLRSMVRCSCASTAPHCPYSNIYFWLLFCMRCATTDKCIPYLTYSKIFFCV